MTGRARYTVGDDGDLMRVGPTGQVSLFDSLTDGLLAMKADQDQGLEVLIDGEPLKPRTGLLGWIWRLIDRFSGFKA